MVEFWLKKGTDAFRLPVNPPSVSIEHGFNHKEITVMGLGDISFPQSRELMRYSISSFFPEKYNPAYCEYSGFPAPFDCVDKLQKWMDDGTPVRLTITGTPVNTLVTIRKFDYTPWEHGDNDIPYSLDLSEYRTPTMARVVTEPAPSTPADPPKATAGTVNVGKGKTLTVYKTASTKGKTAGKLKHATKVTINATISGWYQIKGSGVSGYAKTKYITVTATTATAKTTATVEAARPVETHEKGVLNA
jgi:hypothetical protein